MSVLLELFMLEWELLFIRKQETSQDIMFSRIYQNGEPIEREITPEKEMLVNYVSLFPQKNIIRIKMGVTGRKVYSFYYINKAYFDLGFLGVLGVSEFHEKNPYDWIETEIIAKFIFAEYFKRLCQGELNHLNGAQKYLEWIDNQIADYYLDFLDSKEEYYNTIYNETKANLQQAFLIEANLEEEIKEDWSQFTRKVEFQLISSIGTPITRIISFVEGKMKSTWDENEEIAQSLQGMSYSALQSFIEQQNQGLNLQMMKVKKPQLNGFEFILFRNYKVKNKFFFLIMTVENYHNSEKIFMDTLLGYEEDLIEKIMLKFDEHRDWFHKLGQISSKEVIIKVENLIESVCQDYFIQ